MGVNGSLCNKCMVPLAVITVILITSSRMSTIIYFKTTFENTCTRCVHTQTDAANIEHAHMLGNVYH